MAGQPRRVRDHQLGRAARRGAVQGGRRAVGLPAAARERVLPLPRRGDLAAVLPPAPAERLPVDDHGGARASSRPPTRRRSTGRRASRPRPWVASTTPGPRARAVMTRACALATRRGTRYHPKPIAGTTSYLHRGARPHSGVVRCHPALRHRRQGRWPGPEPPHLRRGHVEDHELPRHPLARLELRADQVLRPDPVPGRQDPQQRAAVVAVQAEDEPPAAGHVLGHGAAVQALADLGRWARRGARPSADGDRRSAAAPA